MTAPLLDIRKLTVRFATRAGSFTAVDGVDLQVHADEVLAVVGESGSGKSVAMLAVMGLLPWTATVDAQRMDFDGRDLRTLSAAERRRLLGQEIAMIFQEPMASLNPCFPVGWQIAEMLAAHTDLPRDARKKRVVELLEHVGIPDAARRARSFPHQLSGGMSQRVMIAMAIACSPRLLIADEPTTALDVTIQAQILDLLDRLRREHRMAMVLITHDLGVVAQTAHRVSVQYAGQVVERGETASVLSHPHHPYTAALLAALPEHAAFGERLHAIPGRVPGAGDRLPGCLFAPRCAFADAACEAGRPQPAPAALHHARCIRPLVDGRPQPLQPLGDAAIEVPR